MMEFNDNEILVLNAIQKGLPPVEDPFLYLSGISRISQEGILKLVLKLKKEKIIRNISGIFDGTLLGYSLSLVTFKVPEERIERVSEIINSHPGVSHNYLREHEYNVWFTIAEYGEDALERAISLLMKESGISDCLILKNEKLLKIGVLFEMGSDSPSKISGTITSQTESKDVALSGKEKEAVMLLQKDLPVESNPYARLLKDNNSTITVDELLRYFKKFLDNKIMRRYAAVLMHRNAGYRANAMTVWKTDDDFNADVFMNCSSISHLYMRTVYPGKWEYPLFAMIHEKSDEELENTINELSEKSGIKDYLKLTSLKEFKKKKVHYFSREFDEWKRLKYD